MFLGIVIIFVGAILLLERLDIIEGGFSTYWPVLLIALGISIVANQLRRRG